MANRNQSAHPLRDEELVLTNRTDHIAPGANATELGTLDLGGSAAGVAGEMVSNRFRGKVVVEVHDIVGGTPSQAFVTLVGANDTGFSSGVVVAMIPIANITGDGAAIGRGVGKHQQPFENLAQAFDGTQRSFRYIRAHVSALGGTGTITLSVWLTKD